MLNEYEEMREQQINFLYNCYNQFIVKTKKDSNKIGFGVDIRKLYAVRIADLLDFANEKNMTFEFDSDRNVLILRDVRR